MKLIIILIYVYNLAQSSWGRSFLLLVVDFSIVPFRKEVSISFRSTANSTDSKRKTCREMSHLCGQLVHQA
ncbi:AAEL011066-PA [Aedes aegypti]|uniref:AAEL011066-PA n=1 Tax=Aedes aegypti TaxID=7159 RepID=Q16R68_AEDAE|nr:AAEL011066-PA [Aedes aegypti]